MINWLAVYWAFDGDANQQMQVVVEAETRGWVGMGFTDSSMTLPDSEVVIGWINKSDISATLDVANIRSYRLTGSSWSSVVDNSKKVPIEKTSMCQTRDGRTILRFSRKTGSGRHPVLPWAGNYNYAVVAVGDEDKIGDSLDTAIFAMAAWQGSIGPDEPEGWSFRWIMTYVLLVFQVMTWLFH